MAEFTPTERPKSVPNHCVTLPFWNFCLCRVFVIRLSQISFLLSFLFLTLKSFLILNLQLLRRIHAPTSKHVAHSGIELMTLFYYININYGEFRILVMQCINNYHQLNAPYRYSCPFKSIIVWCVYKDTFSVCLKRAMVVCIFCNEETCGSFDQVN